MGGGAIVLGMSEKFEMVAVPVLKKKKTKEKKKLG